MVAPATSASSQKPGVLVRSTKALDHGALDLALQRAGAVAGMEPALRKALHDRVVDLDEKPPPRDALAHQQSAELATGDSADGLRVERVKREHAVDPVEELRPE